MCLDRILKVCSQISNLLKVIILKISLNHSNVCWYKEVF